MVRYARLFAMQLRASLLLGLQYRFDFLIDGALEVFWTATALIPLLVVFGQRQAVAGWTFGEALLVTAWFTLLQGILEGAINPSLASVVEHIRKGTLDFVLIKPADAQFLVSTARFYPWKALNVFAAIAIFIYAFARIGHGPSIAGVAMAMLLLVTSTAILYSLWILTVSAAFYVVKIDNLSFLFGAVFDAARWPVHVFRGAVRFLFTFVLPLALMTTYPAMAMLGRLDGRTLGLTIAGAVVFTMLARVVWMASIRRYTSASS